MDPMILVFGGVAIVLLFILGTFMAALYQKVGPNTAMIVSGGGGTAKVIVGGGTVILPLVNKMDILSLELMQIEIQSNSPMFSMDGIPLVVEGVAQIKIPGDERAIMAAAEHLLGKSADKIQKTAEQIIMGHVRAVLATLRVDDLIRNFGSFSEQVVESAKPDLAKTGLAMVSFTINEIKDNVGYLDTIGKRSTDALLLGNSSLIGKIAVVTEEVSFDNEGQISYELQHGMPPKTVKAKTRLNGYAIPVDTAVVIRSSEADCVFVEPWSAVKVVS